MNKLRMSLDHEACVFLTDMQKNCGAPLQATGLPGTPLLINGEYAGQCVSFSISYDKVDPTIWDTTPEVEE